MQELTGLYLRQADARFVFAHEASLLNAPALRPHASIGMTTLSFCIRLVGVSFRGVLFEQ